MRKLILFSILTSSFLAFPKTLLVPEEFTMVQQAVVAAHNGDTVSVNYGRPNGQKSIVSSQRIMGKTIIFEVRGEGKGELLRMINGTNSVLNADKEPRQYLLQGWQGQQQVNEPDTLFDCSYSRAISMDSHDNPGVVWIGEPDPSIREEIFFRKWNGTAWAEEMQINSPDTFGDWEAAITFDDNDSIWVVWSGDVTYDQPDIFYSRWNGLSWSLEQQVCPSPLLDYAPIIAAHQRNVWLSWDRMESHVGLSHIFVSHWDNGIWAPETQLSPIDSGVHWFSNIALDDSGRPNVVWCEGFRTRRIYYRKYDGNAWTDPVWINGQVQSADWGAPMIAIDNCGNIHVVWVGVASGEQDKDIFYSKFDGNTWSTPIRLNQNDTYDDYYPCISASSPNNVWVAWDKEFSLWDCHVYAVHFNGDTWTEEERFDNDSISYCNSSTSIALNRNEDPWVIFEGIPVNGPNFEIYYNRYVSSGIDERHLKPSRILSFKCLPSYFAHNLKIFFNLLEPGFVTLTVYDARGNLIKTLVNRFQPSGGYDILWDGKDNANKIATSGVYFLRLEMRDKEETKKIIRLKEGG